MGWMARRWGPFALARSSREGVCGIITEWDTKGKSVWCHIIGKLWLRIEAVPVRWGP